jgi:hypothetical protein
VFLLVTDWVFISQMTTFFIVTAMKTSVLPSAPYLEYRTMDNVQNPSDSECYTPSSGSSRTCMLICFA